MVHGMLRREAAGILAWVLAVSGPSALGETPSGEAGLSAALRAEASTAEGLGADVTLSKGAARFLLRAAAEPGSAPDLRLGTAGPLWTAGPSRHSGPARVLADPCADAYLVSEAWPRPLVLDMDAPGYGAFAGGSAGAWIQDAEAPRAGIWGGREADRGFLAGAAAAASLLPAEGGFDAWFSEEPGKPARLLAAALAWAGWSAPEGRAVAAAAVSEEDRGGRGGAFRAEGEWGRKEFRWTGRVSAASPAWRGLEGTGADLWEVRTDVSWALSPRLRLEGRIRAGRDSCGVPDWESRIRASWNVRTWRWGVEADGSDSGAEPPLRLEPAAWAGYEGPSFRASGRVSWVTEGSALSRAELLGSLSFRGSRHPGFRLEGGRRREPEGGSWKASAVLDLPADRGTWTVRAGTTGWIRDGTGIPAEFSFCLRARVP